MSHDFKVLDSLQPVSLSDIADAKLMNRIDTKYLTTVSKLPDLLHMARTEYMVLEIDKRRRLPYYSCYFDTEDAEMFYEHQRGRKSRQKVRIRRYEGDNELSFLEIKNKNNKGRTKKKRVEMEGGTSATDYSDFVANHSNYYIEDLIPHIENHFYRITLVRKDLSERVTIDTGVEFHNLVTDRYDAIPEVMIIEWKRKALSEYSPMRRILKELGIRESGFSKYCVGMARTNPLLRQNRLKEKIRRIDKLRPLKVL